MRLAPYLILLAETLFFFRLSLSGDFVIPWDLGAYHLPFSSLDGDAVLRGELPLWDPVTYCGRPVLTNIQAQVLYPPRAIAAAIGAIAGHRHHFYLLEWLVALHAWLAGCLMFRLAASLRMSAAAAMLAASVYAFGGFFAAHAEHLGAVCVAAWLPLAIQSASGGRPRDRLLLAFALSMSVLAGFTPMTAIVWAAAFVANPRGCAMAGAGAVLLTAAQLAPTIELASLSVAKYRTDWLGTGGGVPAAALRSLGNARFLDGYEATFVYLFCGTGALALAIFGSMRARWWAAACAAAALAMLGDSTAPVRWLQTSLPDAIRRAYYPEYCAAVFVLALACLAGFGLDRLPRWRAAAAALCVAELLAVNSRLHTHAMPREKERIKSRVDFAELRERTRAASPPFRIDTRDDALAWAMSGPITGIPTANGYDPMALERVMQVRLGFAKGERWGAYYKVEDPASPLLGAMNVRYLVNGGRIEEVAGTLPRFHSSGAGAARVTRYEPHAIDLETEAAADETLISSEAFYPGWRAFVDGVEVPMTLVNTAFRGHPVPAGRHTVRWIFDPWISKWSGAVSLLAWLAWVVAWHRCRGRAEA